MVTINAVNTPSTRTRRNRIALILSIFCFLSFYTIDESEFLSFLSSDESPSENRRQLISDNVWEAELQARQLRLTGNNLNKKQRVQIERKRMLEEDVASGEPSDNIWSSKGRGPPTSRYIDKHRFEDCVGETIASCQDMINAYVANHTESFNNRTSLNLSVRKLREETDLSYYKVVLTTNLNGTLVEGIYSDGMIYYPWGWRVSGEVTDVGPWDCAEKTPEECCETIQLDVPEMDDQGNYIACFVEEPVGGTHNPELEDRAIGVADSGGKIIRAPIYH
eukprot:scaffold1898_cov125-Skeletonema_marinoi.AAC.1